jgi:hypothetical protein
MPCPSHPPWLDQSNYHWRHILYYLVLSFHFLLLCLHLYVNVYVHLLRTFLGTSSIFLDLI